MAIREESYADFSRRVHGRAAGKRVHVNIDYDVTYRCNLNCRHCYCNLPANDREAKEKELSLDEIERILTEARDLGALWILLTGGEPLLRPDFREIYLMVVRLGLIPSVFTNATLVTEEWADFFAEHRPFKMEVTLYGSCAEVYERVTRTPGSFEKCMRGIRLLKDRGLSVNLKTMALRSNYEDLPRVKDTAVAMGLQLAKIDPMVHGRYTDLLRPKSTDPLAERLGEKEVIEIDMTDGDRRREWLRCSRHLMDMPKPKRGFLVSCGAGRSSVSLAADGTVRPCKMLRFLGWDARAVELGKIWNSHIPQRLATPSPGPERCLECALASLCGMCPGWAWLEHRALGKAVAYLCGLAHARERVFAPQVSREVVQCESA